MLEKDYAFFKTHREEYLQDHRGEYVVIKNEALIGFFPNQIAALWAMKDEELGTFLVKNVLPADKDVVEFHTRRVAFV